MAMALHAQADDLALKDIECREQGGDAVALESWVMVPTRPFFIGRPGCWVPTRIEMLDRVH
jgi:hypothetical protein